MGAAANNNVGDLLSSLPSRAAAKDELAPPRPSQPLPRPDGTDDAPYRVMTNRRGWMIFSGIIIAWLLLASVVVLFATHWS
ncbi:MAG: hypothetical protein DME65_08985 [Verrucomicrobia bacterium]|nr:MAG: hypothetical protein DME65_08985 [Verrucomicrobiota bacterium]